MELESLLQVVVLGGVVLLSFVDLQGIERRARARHARTREASSERRCPFCHLEFEEDEEGSVTVRCASCGTPHHAACWTDHGGCSVFGCGSADLRPAERSGHEDRPPGLQEHQPDLSAEIPVEETLTESTPRG